MTVRNKTNKFYELPPALHVQFQLLNFIFACHFSSHKVTLDRNSRELGKADAFSLFESYQEIP